MSGTTLQPIVVLVDDETLAEIERVASDVPPAPFALLLQRNNWTMEMLIAGKILRAALLDEVAP